MLYPFLAVLEIVLPVFVIVFVVLYRFRHEIARLIGQSSQREKTLTLEAQKDYHTGAEIEAAKQVFDEDVR